MAETYMEKRIVNAGIRLCKERMERSGSVITADDLLKMKVRTFSPFQQTFYWVVGLFFVGFGIWSHLQLHIMAISFTPVLIGIGNICYGQYGRPRKVSEIVSEGEIMNLTADIVQRFVAEMDAKRAKKSN